MCGQTNEMFFKGYGIIFDMNISNYSKIVYLYLSKCKNNKTNKCFPCHYQISKACSIGITSVKSAIKELESVKLIKKEHRFLDSKKGKTFQTSNEYTVYSQPYDSIENVEKIEQDVNNGNNKEDDRGEMAKIPEPIPTPTINPIKINTTTPPSQYADRTIINFNNKNTNDIHTSINLYKSNQNDMIDSLNYIFNNCMLDKYDKPLQEIVLNTIVNMYADVTHFSSRKKIPLELIRSQLMKLNVIVVDTAIGNYRYALEKMYPIDNHNLYFESVLWNAIINSYTEQVRNYNAS
jgi:hypothetical protein